MNTEPDNLFDRVDVPVRPFRFDAEVVRVFPDMVRRSVPGYTEMVEISGLIGRQIIPPGGICYDLGCSLGAVTQAILRQTPASVRVIAVDNSPAMIAKLCASSDNDRVTPICADAETVPIQNAALVVLNLTLQFIAPERRLALLERIHAGLMPNGALILVEKIALPNDRGGALLTELHTDFKRAQGYSELAISGKRAALEQVLIPDRIATHEARFTAAGFTGFTRWYQSLNFIAWMAWK